ncbi:MAG: cold shock domain-containing protein [Proteobacteria bacterium]|nr:cold shock domain-containing protein [Pseudomonadota bacterium]MBU1737236.1 cold shock domain-containing protein [Pseudomonadota bacterium]
MELQVEGRHVDIRNSWQTKIDVEKDRLDRHHPGLVHNLRVAVEATTSHKEGGYEVRLIATVPNDTLIVKRKGDAVKPLLVKAFDNLGQQLKEMQRKKRQSSKGQEGSGPEVLTGIIKTVSPPESFGFIVTGDGREIYFHENALKDAQIGVLNEGDAVTFGETEGDKGPCASWVKLTN